VGVAALVCLVTGMAISWSAGIVWAAALLGLEHVWGLLLVQSALAGWTPIVGAGLLLMTELAYWSLELRTPIRDDPAVHRQRAAAVGGLAAAGGVLASVPLLAAEVPLPGSPVLTMVGALAAVALLAGLVALAPRSGAGSAR
jgi:hypothetical protein